MNPPGKPHRPKILEDPAELRRRAESRLSAQQEKLALSRTHTDSERQVHELEVHQIELQMQNEELQESRTELEALLEKYTDLYDFAPLGYLTLDQQGVIREANLAAADLLRIPRSSLVNRRFGHFVSGDDFHTFDALLQKIFASRVRQSCEVTLKMGGYLSLEAELEAIAFESGEACRLALTDITARKRAETDRLIMNKLESTGILAGGIAHDFNNLLTVILLNLDLAQKLKLADERLVCILEEAKQTCALAGRLTAQLVTFSKGGAPVRKPTLLAGLILESVRLSLSGSNVHCQLAVAEDLWVAEVDAGQMGQVIRGIVLNAREAMPQGGMVRLRAKNVVLSALEHPFLAAGEYILMSITDQGAGITTDVLPKIFDPYFSTKHRGDQKGMGLGLTICHSVVQKHGGAIAVKSEAGVGTTFEIYLPASPKLSMSKPASAPAGVPQQKGRVLVMDDEEGIRKILGLTLAGMGHAVELAADGRAAIEVFKAAKSLGRDFDAVILDLTVREGMGGQEAILALLEIDPKVKAVAMSGYVDSPAILEPERYGFKCAMPKPFTRETLQEALSLLVASNRAAKL